MKKLIGISLLTFIFCQQSTAQDDLFGTKKREAKKGMVLSINVNLDFPAADMAKRFGLGYRVGPSAFYKTKSNWIIGGKADFLLGNKIKEEGFLNNILADDKSVISQDGYRGYIETYERGYTVGLMVGRILNTSKNNPDNGILFLTSAGFIQHKIHIITRGAGNIPQLSGDYKKGYDRLTNGLFIEQFVGYTYFSNNGLINFNIGLDVLAGFTEGRRDYLFDVQKTGNDKRFDMLWGLRGGWYIPIFKRKSEDIFFE